MRDGLHLARFQRPGPGRQDPEQCHRLSGLLVGGEIPQNSPGFAVPRDHERPPMLGDVGNPLRCIRLEEADGHRLAGGAHAHSRERAEH